MSDRLRRRPGPGRAAAGRPARRGSPTGTRPSRAVVRATTTWRAAKSVREAANRVWAYLRGVWTGVPRGARRGCPSTDRAHVSLTRERWLLVLLDQLGYGRVPLTGAGGLTVDDQPFPVCHVWEHVPIHLLGWGVDLDRRTPGRGRRGRRGAAGDGAGAAQPHRRPPVGDPVQRPTLRLLRDSTSLVGSAYVEFDLEAIFDGELFADFVLLYTLLPRSPGSRYATTEDGPGVVLAGDVARRRPSSPASRALDQLRDGVVERPRRPSAPASSRTPTTPRCASDVDDGDLAIDDFHHALLRLVYRLLFSFVAEDRGALLDPDADAAGAGSATRRTSPPTGCGAPRGAAAAAATATCGRRSRWSWRRRSAARRPSRARPARPRRPLRAAASWTSSADCVAEQRGAARRRSGPCRSVPRTEGRPQRVVDYRNLGAEELGSIYESLLELVPRCDPARRDLHAGELPPATSARRPARTTPRPR